jgi:diguanylate cyclase (GGDEF)-like protein
MSFRARLTLFFVLIVIVPMLSVAIVLFRLISDNETGKADASVAAAQRAAGHLYADAQRQAGRTIRVVGSDEQLALALRAGDAQAARDRAQELARQQGIERVVLAGGPFPLDVGDRDAVAPTRRDLVGEADEHFGRLELSVESAREYAADVKRITETDVVVKEGARTLASTVPAGASIEPPPVGEAHDVDAGDRSYRAVALPAPGFFGRRITILMLSPDTSRNDAIARSRLLAGGILFGFLVLAMTFAVAVSRSLQAQIGSFLLAARRIASGDFSTEVTTTGNDEFAELGNEFNKMSHQLESRLEDLRQERARLQTSLRRIGETFASNLDRDALLEIVLRTAVDGLDATGGRASARPAAERALQEVARTGHIDGNLEAIRAAEAEALLSGARSEASTGDMHALAQPLVAADGGELVGLLTIARGQPFADRDRELLAYLAGTAGISLQNVGLHETVQRQAVTDELTGLYNHRRFQEAMVDEAERARRFGQPMSLVMLDIDNFKTINDTYGHQQGDRVLAEVARVLRDTSREIDAPARYGGEELAVVLPGTDLDGAFQLAERMRDGIAALAVVPPQGGRISVTASFGVASLPENADDPGALLAAADSALYEAKRGGKNKTVRAGGRV